MARNRGRIAGLTEALEEYFAGQLDIQRDSDGKRCHGEDVCSDPRGIEAHEHPDVDWDDPDIPRTLGPIARYPLSSIEDVCRGCSLKATKPGQHPSHLSIAINSVLELADLPENATFAYPDALDIWGWAGLRALSRARNSDLKKSSKQQPKDAQPPPGPMLVRKPGEKASAVQTFDWSRITATPND